MRGFLFSENFETLSTFVRRILDLGGEEYSNLSVWGFIF